jgi:glycine oxidase
LTALEAELAATVGAGFLLPDLAQVRNPWHLKALIADCRRLGVDLRTDAPVRDVRLREDGAPSIATDEGTLTASHVVIAAGAWTPTFMQSLLPTPQIRPVRGQMVLLRLDRPPLARVIECGNRYIVPRSDGRVLVGATEELAGYDKQTTVSAVAGLMQFATELAPCLSKASVEGAWAGLRPQSSSGLPFIGPLPASDRALLAAGHFRAGLHLSPITARLIRQQILNQTLDLDIGAFDPGASE